jgi:quercetin dioxygenase-like cupin family protein
MRKPRGCGSGVHSHANEQFTYVVSGSLLADLDGQVLPVAQGHVIHIPPGMPHSLVAGTEEDAIVFTAKDTRDANAASDDECDGRRHLAGCGTVDHEWRTGPDGVPVAATRKVSPGSVRYVYAIAALDEIPAGDCSAKVTPRGYVSKKSSSFGAALSGRHLHVGLIHKARGSGSKLHTHPNEQFNWVLQGELLVEVNGQQVRVPKGCMVHFPIGIVHSTVALADEDVIFYVVKDTSHGMSGPPVDGIEDGPRYLPGFGPKK